MLQVDLKTGSGVILDNVRHHARPLEKLALELFAWMTMVLGADQRNWVFRQARTGANSFSLTDGYRNYHFRGDHQGTIRVYSKAREGSLLATLTTRTEVRDFIEQIAAPANVGSPVGVATS